jgi:hypothetical protein
MNSRCIGCGVPFIDIDSDGEEYCAHCNKNYGKRGFYIVGFKKNLNNIGDGFNYSIITTDIFNIEKLWLCSNHMKTEDKNYISMFPLTFMEKVNLLILLSKKAQKKDLLAKEIIRECPFIMDANYLYDDYGSVEFDKFISNRPTFKTIKPKKRNIN